MIRKLTYLILLTVIWACNQSEDKKEKAEQQKQIKSEPKTDELSEVLTFDHK